MAWQFEVQLRNWLQVQIERLAKALAVLAESILTFLALDFVSGC